MMKQLRVILVVCGALVTSAACDDEEKSVATEGEGENPFGEGVVAGEGGDETPPDGTEGDAGSELGAEGDDAAAGDEGDEGWDPCDPNPCDQATALSVCEYADDGFDCTCDDEFYEPDGEGDCKPRLGDPVDAPIDSPPESEDGTYAPSVLIVGAGGVPVTGARLVTGGRFWESNARGSIRLAGQSLAEAIGVRISAPGYVETHASLTWLNAGDAPLRVRLSPVELSTTLPSGVGGTLRTSVAEIALPGNGIVSGNGRRYEGPVHVRVGTLVRGRDEFSDFGQVAVGLNPAGREVPLKPLVQVSVELKDSDGRPLQISADRRVPIRVTIPGDAGVDAGDTLGVSAYDPGLQLWVQERQCVVEQAEDGTLSCEAAASHFSSILWTGTAHQSVCGRPTVRFVGVPTRFEVTGRGGLSTHDCPTDPQDPDHCRLPAQTELGCYYSDDGTPACRAGGGLFYTTGCTVFAYDPAFAFFNVRWTVTLTDLRTRVETERSGVTSVDIPAVLAEQAGRATFATRWRQAWRSRLCEPNDLGCRHFTVEVDLSDIAAQALSGYTDVDGDLWPDLVGGDGGDGGDQEGLRLDCDDQNPAIHPGATEILCNEIDENCDGDLGPESLTPADFADDPEGWNTLCALREGDNPHPSTLCMQLGDEVTGNDLDEDCDGGADDRDGDRVFAPDDCDDTDPDVKPGVQEIPHNDVDEDCDGRAVDQDNDGFGMPDHFGFGGLADDKYTDCNDFDDTIFPGAEVGNRESTFGRFFGVGDAAGERELNYCANFRPDGGLRLERRYLLQDVNCDGYNSDADGDGWFLYGDPTAPIGRMGDCDDLDPRVHPGEDDNGAPMACAEAVERVNDGDCVVNLTRFGGGLPEDRQDGEDEAGEARLSCPNLPSGIPSECVNLVNEDRVPQGPRVCSAHLAPELPPNPFGFGQVWGPCDFDGILPPCGPDAQCGIIGDARYRQDYIESLLVDFGYDVSAARYHGFCFPTCGSLCDPTPCGDPEGSTCEIGEGVAVCDCLDGFEEDDDGLCVIANAPM